MPSEQLRLVLESIASLAGIVALIAIALELQRARKSDAREYLFHMYEKFEELSNARVFVLSLEFSTLEELIVLTGKGESDDTFFKVFNFWDLFTKTVRDNTINREMAFEHFGIAFIQYYDKYATVFHQLGEIKGGFNNFDSFDWFSKEFLRAYPGELESVRRRNAFSEKVLAQTS